MIGLLVVLSGSDSMGFFYNNMYFFLIFKNKNILSAEILIWL